MGAVRRHPEVNCEKKRTPFSQKNHWILQWKEGELWRLATETIRLKAKSQRQARRYKDAFLKEQCARRWEPSRHNSKEMCKVLREVAGQFTLRMYAIKGNTGELLTEKDETGYSEGLWSHETRAMEAFTEIPFALELYPCEEEVT